MLFEYKRAAGGRGTTASKEDFILTDGRTKAEADAKLREIIKRRGGLVKDWILAWSA